MREAVREAMRRPSEKILMGKATRKAIMTNIDPAHKVHKSDVTHVIAAHATRN